MTKQVVTRFGIFSKSGDCSMSGKLSVI